MTDHRQLERWIGAVLAPEVRSPGTIASANEVVPSREYLERFPPAMVVAFGRTPAGAVSPTPQLERVKSMCRELGNAEPFVACDLEQGAGLHFAEATRLPPALALASASLAEGIQFQWVEQIDVETLFPSLLYCAGELTGREAAACGVDVVFAPVCDVNTRRDNPIIAVRSFGDDPRAVAARAKDFAYGLRGGGVASCAKHFPGHGDTSQDSHVELPRIDRAAASLRDVELRAFSEAQMFDAVMVAHLDVPALTRAPGVPCTLSRRVVEGVLREELRFDGAVLSDAMNMGALDSQPDRYVRALDAGCDGLLCPHDLFAAAHELMAAVESGRLSADRLARAAQRVVALPEGSRAIRAWLQGQEPSPGLTPTIVSRNLPAQLADWALRRSPVPWPRQRHTPCSVLDPLPRSETPEVNTCVDELRASCGGSRDSECLVLPVICELRAWSGRYGLGPDDFAELERRIDEAARTSRRFVVAWFGSPQTLPERLWHDRRVGIVLAFAPTPPMFQAVARFLAGSSLPPSGSLPAKLG